MPSSTPPRRRAAPYLLLLALLAAPLAAGDGQAEPSQPARFAGRSLTEALLELQAQGLEVLFNSRVVRPEMRVLEEPASTSPREVLDELLAPHGLVARPGPGGRLVVMPKADEETSVAAGTVRGRVRERGTLRPVPGVQVLLAGSGQQTISGDDGNFSFPQVPAGVYALEARRPGFVVERLEDVEVPAGGAGELSLELVPVAVPLDEIIVTPSQVSLLGSEPAAAVALPQEEIVALPHLGGDLFRALSLLPGTSANELTSELHVRGGRSDEVLVRLDQLELIEPYHLQDFLNAFSIVAPRAVGEVDLLLGAFPARFGDRMGGVLDMRTSQSERERRHHLAAGVLGAQAGASGTFAAGRGEWQGLGRFGFPELFLNYLGDQERPRYWDLFAKVDYQSAAGRRLGIRFLHADDSFELSAAEGGDTETADTDYRSSYAWLTFQSPAGPRVYADSILSAGRLDRDRRSVETEGEEDGFSLRDERALDAAGLRQDWSYQPADRHYLRLGFEIRRLEAEVDYSNFRQLDDPLAQLRFEPRSGSRSLRDRFRDDHYALYASERLGWGDSLTFEAGLRYDHHTLAGDRDLSPRLNLVVALDEASALRAAWGYFFQSQRPYELQVEDGETAFHSSERSEHFALGFERLLRRGTTLRIDAYRREIRDPRPRYENVFEPVSSFPEIEPDRVRLDPDRSSSQGVELFLRHRGDRFGWWVSYAYSRVEDRIDGRDVPRGIDQPHALNLDLDLRLGDRWRLNLAFRYHTGWPTTALGGRLEEGEDGELEPVPVFGPLFGERLSDYHRLDLRASRRWQLPRGELALYFDLQNVYDRKNVAGLDVEPEFEVLPDGSVELLPVVERWGGFLPSVGLEWEF